MLSHSSCIRLCVTLWAEAHQAPLSMGFPRQQYWSFGLPFPSLGIFPTQELNLSLLHAGGVFTISTTSEAPMLR